MARRSPSLDHLLLAALREAGDRPAAFILAGHNGSGKSTLWYERLAGQLKLPLVNADRLTLSILPEPDRRTRQLPAWAQRLRDEDERWHRLSQQGVRLFKTLITEERIPFAFETVFSYWERGVDGRRRSKADDIKGLQKAGYFVVLLFVGLVSPELSVLRVRTRRQQGGHDVARDKLVHRFPRTQAAIGHAAPLADMTLMFDNSRSAEQAFGLVRAQRRRQVLYDVRDVPVPADPELRMVAALWLDKVVGPRRGRRKPVKGDPGE